MFGEGGVPPVPVNVAELLPLGMTTEAGTLRALVDEAASVTAKPSAGAGLSMVTVPVPLVALASGLGLKATVSVFGFGSVFTFRAAFLESPERVAVSVTSLSAFTTLVVTLKVAEFDPLGIVTDAGTVAAVLLELSWTWVAVKAFLSRVTVPVTTVADPPRTDVGETLKLERTAGTGSTVRVADLLVEL